MEGRGLLLCCILNIAVLTALAHGLAFSRISFPPDFIFGAGSAAYQQEGSPLKYGRGPSIWDTFVKEFPGKIHDNSNGEVTNDFYHRYKDDIKLMKHIGLDSFRMSISWSRILPNGKISGGVNQIGVQFYNDIINELLANGIKPFVTLLHFDPPQSLEDEYGGLRSFKIIKDYVDFADFCFKTYGDRVKHWATINEPNIFASFGYETGSLAPGRCSSYQGNCPAGNSATEPYIVGHHMLLCHAAAARLYKNKYQANQKGEISIAVAVTWYIPLNNIARDRLAASRALDFYFGWFISPVTYGDYPKSMRKLVGKRLPNFTKEESDMLKGSIDYLSLNYYTSSYVYSAPSSCGVNLSYSTDGLFRSTSLKNGVPIGPATAFSSFYVYPKGLQKVLVYIKEKYDNPTIYITENGLADSASLPLETALNDTTRISFLKSHFSYLLKAIKDGVKVKGYYGWSFLDDWEWNSGYTVRFGLTYVDFHTLKRYLKASAYWYKKFISS